MPEVREAFKISVGLHGILSGIGCKVFSVTLVVPESGGGDFMYIYMCRNVVCQVRFYTPLEREKKTIRGKE